MVGVSLGDHTFPDSIFSNVGILYNFMFYKENNVFNTEMSVTNKFDLKQTKTFKKKSRRA